VISSTDLVAAFRHVRTAAVVVRAEDAVVLALNPSAERLLGYSATEAVGRLPSELALWPDLAARARLWADLGSDGSARALNTRLRCRSGALVSVCLDVEPVQVDGVLALLCLLQRSGEGEAVPSAALPATGAAFRRALHGPFLQSTPALAELLGYPGPVALREAVPDVAQVYADAAHFRSLQELLQRQGSITGLRSELHRRDGSSIWVSEQLFLQRGIDGAADLIEGSYTDITETVLRERALRQSEALYKVLVDNCRDGVFLIQHGVVHFANAALAEMLRRPVGSLIGSQYMELVHPDDRAEQLQRRAARESGSVAAQRYSIRLLRGDGSVGVFAVCADAVVYEGELASSGVMRDVTEERAKQEALQAAERRYRELFESSPIGLFKSHPDGRLLEINPPLLQLIGYDSLEQLRADGVTMGELYADPAQRGEVLARVRREGALRDEEILVRSRDGRLRWANVSMKVVPGSEGNVEFAGTVQDYTEKRAAEQALQRSEAKYRALVEHAQVGVFVARDGRFVYGNGTLCLLLGYAEAALLERAVDALRSDDRRAAAAAAWDRLLRGDSDSEEFESCYLRADGSRVWVTESVGRVEIDGIAHLTGTVRDISRQREVERRLRYYATHDALTGLPNRLDFQQRLDELIQDAHAREQYDYAVLFLDLDGFKLINDSLGHAAGDRLLVGLAGQITDVLGGEALVARYGGDEFTVLPFGPCDRPRAIGLAERILNLFQQPIDIGDEQAFSSASVGVVIGAVGYRDASEVLRDADTAMYRAKAAGKAAYAVFDEAMHDEARRRFQLEVELRAGLERGEFEVHYQPIVALPSARVVGCEALVRWRHPRRGLLMPAEFLPVAEENALIVKLDSWVLRQACSAARRWLDHGWVGEGFHLNVNVNERQISAGGFADDLRETLRGIGLPASALRLEITESVFRSGRHRATELLNALKQVGVQLVVDDFGTGYSSLDSFAAAPFDALKIDRGFIADLESNPRHRAIVRTIIGFASDLGLALTAEGVEEEAQETFLRSFGCATAQGWRYGRAMPEADFAARLRQPPPALISVG
jgi:diguanylate cyclase (GGDEF)-like protein/PAS domain S-box-containing protein